MQVNFIRVDVVDKDGKKSTRFINVNHIQQVYESKGIIFIELTGYDTVEVHGEQIAVFMDRFVK